MMSVQLTLLLTISVFIQNAVFSVLLDSSQISPLNLFYSSIGCGSSVCPVVSSSTNCPTTSSSTPIVCDSTGFVTIIAISSLSNAGSLPISISQLSRLTLLRVTNSPLLSGTLPSTLGSLTQLRELWLLNNQLTGSIVSQLGRLSLLTSLALQQNRLSNTLPTQFFDATALTLIQLDRNLLSGTLSSAIRRLSNLVRINIAGNQFSGSLPTELLLMTSLVGLFCHTNRFTGSLPLPSSISASECLVQDVSMNENNCFLTSECTRLAPFDCCMMPFASCTAAPTPSPTPPPTPKPTPQPTPLPTTTTTPATNSTTNS
jgi:hypothetical protein